MRLVIAVIVCLLATTRADAVESVTGAISVDLLARNDVGTMRCALFNDAEAFPMRTERAVAKVDAPIRNRRAMCRFPNIAPGTYAVAAFHDENDNRELDLGFLGIPTEGVGTSRNARGTFGPPDFDDAKFIYRGGDVRLQSVVNLVYY